MRVKSGASPCPACGHAGRPREAFRKWGCLVLACRRCGLGWTVAQQGFRPEAIYTEDYYAGGSRYGYGDYSGSEWVLRREFRSSLAHLVRHGARSGRLLEIGSAHGFFMLEAASRFECVGIELSQSAVRSARARGLEVYREPVESVVDRRGPFDAAVLLDTIEHLPDPASVVLAIAKGLVPGGSLLVTTGDFGSVLARALGPRWRLATPPEHLFFFTRRSMKALLERAGFAAVRIDTPAKTVPLGLAALQMARWLALPFAPPAWLSRVPVPVSLFDAMRVVARRLP